jgi:hypothetical protein
MLLNAKRSATVATMARRTIEVDISVHEVTAMKLPFWR